MNATECLLEDVQTQADLRNDEVLRYVLDEIERRRKSDEMMDNCCRHCWTKLEYAETKLKAHRVKKRMDRADGYSEGVIVYDFDQLSINRANLLHKADELRKEMNSVICICHGRVWELWGKPRYG